MSFYEAIQATASQLLDQFGQTVTLRRIGESIYNPITGAVDAADPLLITTTGLFQPLNRNRFSNVEVGDRQMILDGYVEPLQGDSVLIDGKAWAVVEVENPGPTGVPLVYFIRVRR